MADNHQQKSQDWPATRNPLRVLTPQGQDEYLAGVIDAWSGDGWDPDGRMLYGFGFELGERPAPRDVAR